MPVRYKFRSSVGFDSLEVGGRGSILLRDLRAEVLRLKGLAASPDFDLLVSDAISGQAYEDEECEILDGSSIIIKRVPSARSVPSDLNVKPTVLMQNLLSSPSEKFDDFGVDLYPAVEALPQESDTDIGNMYSTAHKEDQDVVVQRGSQVSISRCQNFGGSDLSDDALSKGNIRENYVESGDVDEKKQPILKSESTRLENLDESLGLSSPRMPNSELPTELRCSLCNTIFKEAVMIPCCQHSFCDRCIRSALIERARCPKCTSTKCTVEDLLPNLSLRQAIEHFLETQVAINDPDNVIPKDVPDGESGIQAKEVSCALSIHQKEPQIPHSPSATGKGSNQVTPKSAHDDKKVSGVGSRIIHLNAHKFANLESANQTKGDENHSTVASKQMNESTFSKLPYSLIQKEVKNKVFGVHRSDGNGASMPPNKYRKGGRNCFMCGSPHHLIRDCPAASNSYSMQMGDAALPRGIPAYGQPYWQGSYTHVRPYGSMYGAPGMMRFDPTIFPVGSFGTPSYLSSFYAGMPMPYGFMRMGGVPPPLMTGTERPLIRAEFMDLHDAERNHKHSKEHIQRELDYDTISEDIGYNGTERRSHEQKVQVYRETIRSYSDNDSPRVDKKNSYDKHFYTSSHQRPDFTSDEEFHSGDRRNRKGSHISVSGRDLRTHYYEKSTSELQDVSDSSTHHNRNRKKHYYRSRSRKHSERKGHSGSDCSRRSHHRSRREILDDGEKAMVDHKRLSRKHHNESDSSFEPDSSTVRQQCPQEKESHSLHKLGATDEKLEDDRWEMVDGLGEEYRGGEYHYHRRKRKR